mmetsp:Transcript_44890/g.95563  ORF Transcript_44890/g.95563 Transcript_44890/m.95563 type:complete len:285 (-) Transcript_44890:789-1643(-)
MRNRVLHVLPHRVALHGINGVTILVVDLRVQELHGADSSSHLQKSRRPILNKNVGVRCTVEHQARSNPPLFRPFAAPRRRRVDPPSRQELHAAVSSLEDAPLSAAKGVVVICVEGEDGPAIVGGEEDDGVVPLSRILDRLHSSVEDVVHETHGVGRGEAHVRVARGGLHLPLLKVVRQIHVGMRLVVLLGVRKGSVHELRREHVIDRLLLVIVVQNAIYGEVQQILIHELGQRPGLGEARDVPVLAGHAALGLNRLEVLAEVTLGLWRLFPVAGDGSADSPSSI